jgi:uncharacterized membrane protein YfcA
LPEHPISTEQYIIIGIIFIWTGFVRTGIGFGGSALSLPLLLLINENPLYFLPIIGMHLLFFASLTLSSRIHNVDWPFIRKSLSIMIIPKIIGILGLLNLPTRWLVVIVFSITLFYGIMWLLNIAIQSKNRGVDTLLLILGGYVSGTSLIGAPIIVAVAIKHVKKIQLRETLFVLWFILVVFKMTAFIITGVEMHWLMSLYLLPLAAIGHYIGLKAHNSLMHSDSTLFNRIIGGTLALVSAIGLINQPGMA